MSALSYLVIIFGYLAVLLFIVGVAYRIWNWAHLPQGFAWGVYPKPTKWTFTSLLWKVFAWPYLIRGDKALWVGAIIFHLGMLLLVFGHLGLFADMVAFGESLGIPKEASYSIGIYAGSFVGIVILFYLARRLFITKAKEISTFADHFWLWALLMVVGAGLYARLFHEVSSEEARIFATSVITFSPIMPPDNFWFLIHILLSELFIIYAVAGKPVHSIGQFFTQSILVAKEDVA